MTVTHLCRSAGMSPEAQKSALKEPKRLKKMPQQMPEHAMIRNYLDLMVELPWSKTSTDTLDIAQARSVSALLSCIIGDNNRLLVVMGQNIPEY